MLGFSRLTGWTCRFAGRGKWLEGFTLIEILVGMILTSILVTGLVGVWQMVDDQLFRSTLRQKAVFVLNGHMERLVAMYRSGVAFTSRLTTNNGSATLPLQPATVLILLGDPSGLIQTDRSKLVMGEILYHDLGAAGSSNEDRNVVWLDDRRRITAQLSWTLADTTNSNCFGAVKCQLLTLYLSYPFRFVPEGDPLASMWDRGETLTLQTIVGQR